ncbi:hypothetical protein [Salinivibrio costicola]|uniref:hypothetical protein n=1 Tax=Salinivibrio costicola TaxID=51367 RepID=UPI0025410DC6|nr:hypothetical protein [Salinivibrio costicola]
MDASPSDDDITAIRQGLKQSNAPFLAGLPEGTLAGYAIMTMMSASVALLPIPGANGY